MQNLIRGSFMACVYAGCLSDYIYTKVFSESESVIITKLASKVS